MSDVNTTDELPPPSLPESFGVTIRDWGDETSSRHLGEQAACWMHAISRCIDLSNIDGLTLGADYPKALAELDRGYETAAPLTPSNGIVVGIAMTPSVIRNGQLKSHIVLSAGLTAALLDVEHENFQLALHTMAHECAHVEITAAFERCFPNVLLRTKHIDLQEHYRWEVALACWDEYAATRISAGFGEEPTERYEDTFIEALQTAEENANAAIRAYRLHGDHGRIASEAYVEYGRLLKYAAYLLGDLDARDIAIEDRPRSGAALAEHPFQPTLQRLHNALRDLYNGFGRWADKSPFEAIGDIADDLIGEGGVYITKIGSGLLHIQVPFRPETSPPQLL
jgi:hypothetical protein